MPETHRGRFDFWLSQLLEQAIDPSLEPHWWEVALFLIAMELEPLGESFRPLIQAGSALTPAMTNHLGPYDEVTLRVITKDTVRAVLRLSDTLTDPQTFMVATNAQSLAQALFEEKAWYRAIYAGRAAVGFLMLHDDAEKPEYFLWRLMIAAPFQGRGYGAQAIRRLVEYVRTRPNASELGVSCETISGGPKEFYEKLGFVSTGEYLGNELVLKLPLGLSSSFP